MAKYKGFELPTIEEVFQNLRYWRNNTRSFPDDYSEIEIRLVVGYRDSSMFGNWTINTGSSDYDQWHGHCASEIISAEYTNVDLRNIARSMLEDVKEQIDMSL